MREYTRPTDQIQWGFNIHSSHLTESNLLLKACWRCCQEAHTDLIKCCKAHKLHLAFRTRDDWSILYNNGMRKMDMAHSVHNRTDIKHSHWKDNICQCSTITCFNKKTMIAPFHTIFFTLFLYNTSHSIFLQYCTLINMKQVQRTRSGSLYNPWITKYSKHNKNSSFQLGDFSITARFVQNWSEWHHLKKKKKKKGITLFLIWEQTKSSTLYTYWPWVCSNHPNKQRRGANRLVVVSWLLSVLATYSAATLT